MVVATMSYNFGPSRNCVTTPSLVILPAFEYYSRDLNNAATSRILVNPAVISIFMNNCKFLYFYLCCVNIS